MIPVQNVLVHPKACILSPVVCKYFVYWDKALKLHADVGIEPTRSYPREILSPVLFLT
jgi:hypothetical protein